MHFDQIPIGPQLSHPLRKPWPLLQDRGGGVGLCRPRAGPPQTSSSPLQKFWPYALMGACWRWQWGGLEEGWGCPPGVYTTPASEAGI